MKKENSQLLHQGTFYASKQGSMLIWLGAAVLFLSAFMMSLGFTSPASPGALGAIMLAIGVWSKKSPQIEFHDDYLVINQGPAREKLAILYSEIHQLEFKKNVSTLHYRLHGSDAGARKKVRVSSSGMHRSERDALKLSFLNLKRRIDSCGVMPTAEGAEHGGPPFAG